VKAIVVLLLFAAMVIGLGMLVARWEAP